MPKDDRTVERKLEFIQLTLLCNILLLLWLLDAKLLSKHSLFVLVAAYCILVKSRTNNL